MGALCCWSKESSCTTDDEAHLLDGIPAVGRLCAMPIRREKQLSSACCTGPEPLAHRVWPRARLQVQPADTLGAELVDIEHQLGHLHNHILLLLHVE